MVSIVVLIVFEIVIVSLKGLFCSLSIEYINCIVKIVKLLGSVCLDFVGIKRTEKK